MADLAAECFANVPFTISEVWKIDTDYIDNDGGLGLGRVPFDYSARWVFFLLEQWFL